MDSIERYLFVFDSLRRRKRWSTDTNVLRFAALTLAATEVDDPGLRLEETAAVLAKKAGGFSPLNSSVRHAVAAILIRRGREPARVVHRVKETLAAFKEHGLRKGGAHPLLAALLLVLDAGDSPVSRGKIGRLKTIVDRWNRDHSFLTGADDYPMAAMHATGGTSVEQLGLDVETSYQCLRKAGFSRGNQLQLVSHLLMFSELGPREASHRFTRTAAALKKKGQRVWQGQYDEVALLVLTGAGPEEVATKVVRYRDRLREMKPRPQAAIAFSIATGIVLAEQAEKAKHVKGAAAAANLRAVQSLVEAQQAAIVACISASACGAATAS
jgi:hypothetical protein